MPIREDLHERPGEDEILLDHPVVRPWRHAAPGDDVGLRDHALASTSTSSFRAKCQCASRWAPVIGGPGESGVKRGAHLDSPKEMIGDDLELLRCLVGRPVEGGGSVEVVPVRDGR